MLSMLKSRPSARQRMMDKVHGKRRPSLVSSMMRSVRSRL
jgi:hypothetical protein